MGSIALFYLEHPVILTILVILLLVLAFKFKIWLISFIITEVTARVYVKLYEKYDLKLNFINKCNFDKDENNK
jgi:hypothetical protein